MSLVDVHHCATCTCAPPGTKTTVGYLGWSGHGNMGDDAIRLAIEEALPQLDLLRLPRARRGFSQRAVDGCLGKGGTHSLLLGGGTPLGRRNWRLPLAANLSLAAKR